MMRSLLIKLAMLGATLSAIVWIGSSMSSKSSGSIHTIPAKVPTGNTIPQPRNEAAPAPQTVPARKAVVQTIIASTARLDLNRATLDELTGLSGIGPTLARRMIDHRQAHGRFRTVDDLVLVKGIGPKRLERMREHIAVSTPPDAGRKAGAL